MSKMMVRRFNSEQEAVEMFVCPMCDDEAEKERIRKKKVVEALKALDLNPRTERMTFATFIPQTNKQQAAKEKCVTYAKMVTEGCAGGLLMVGSVGTGKTHMAYSICKEVCLSGKTVKVTSITKMLRHVRSSWGKDSSPDAKTEDEIIDLYAGYGLLVIDEVGIQYGKDGEKITISEIINERYNRMLPTILIGNVTEKEAEEYLGKRVLDRVLDGGMAVVFDWDSHRKMA